jgi:peptide/nickel transport system permease protein
VLTPIIVLVTLSIGLAILTAAGLSFVGLGAQPPTPEWGDMLNDAQGYLQSAWWMAVFPGAAIMIVVVGLNLLGDGLRDLLDPTTR